MTTVLVLVSAAALVLGAALIVASLRARSSTSRDGSGDRLALLLGRLAAVSLVSIPVLWLVLAAEVGEWPGLVCVRGVLKLGLRARSAAAALPWLLAAVVIAKAAHVAAAGTGLALHRLDRATRDAPLARRAAGWTAAAGAFALLDGVATLGWIFLPREGPQISSGCCTADLMEAVEATVPTMSNRTLWTAAFFVAGSLAAAALAAGARSDRLRRPGSPWWLAVFLASAAAAGAGALFGATTLAPTRLGLPLHECAYCLLERAPENWLGVAALAAAPVLTFWAWTSSRAGAAAGVTTDGAAGAPTADGQSARLLRAGAFACVAAMVLGASGRWLT